MEHPITPPPELVEQWRATPEYIHKQSKVMLCSMTTFKLQEIATQAARWGADQELEACCEWVENECPGYGGPYEKLRAARRRPKPPSLKQQALDELDLIPTHDNEGRTVGVDVSIIRRALEQLND